jgi:uncharacterized protein YejL (UPF0352 family)
VVLGEEVSEVVGTALPMDLELLVLGNAVADPVEAHVNGFGSAVFDSVIGNALGTFRCR